MLIKSVRCHVVDAASFDRGQRVWLDLSGLPGFLGQCGGWSSCEPGVAQAFAWWRSEQDHQEFMAGAHDHLASGQVGTYDTIEVCRWEHQLDIGASLLADFSFSNGNLMRLAHCRVKVGRQAHFTWAQVAVWNPGMTASPGMRGGVFARRGQTDFMVLSLWNSVVDHERYVTGRFVDLRRESRAADDLDGITGDLVELDPAWTVTP